MLPLLLNAQNDSKYMVGAVPEVDGKVVFTRHLNVSGFNQEQIFNAVTDWMARTFTNSQAKIIISDPGNGTIVAQNFNEIIARIGIFPGKVKMSSIIKVVCNDGYCMMETSRIRYTNNPTSEKPTDIITAEEYITDRYAMNKTRTKVHKGIGDYRIGTIDIVDKNALDAQSAVYTYNNQEFANYNQTMANIPAPTSSAKATAPQPPTATNAGATNAGATNTAANTEAKTIANTASNTATNTEVNTATNTATNAEVNTVANTEATTQMKGGTASADMNIGEEISNGLKSGEYVTYLIAVESKKLPKPVAGKGVLDLNTNNPAISYALENDADNTKFILEMANNFTLAICKANDTTASNPVIQLDCRKSQQFDKIFIGIITGVHAK